MKCPEYGKLISLKNHVKVMPAIKTHAFTYLPTTTDANFQLNPTGKTYCPDQNFGERFSMGFLFLCASSTSYKKQKGNPWVLK